MDLDKFKRKNYYELLGVPQNASESDLRRAFRDIARIYDPSSNFYADLIDDPPKPRDIEIFKMVSNAFEVLIDPLQRKKYDALLKRTPKGEVPKYDPGAKSDDGMSWLPGFNSSSHGTIVAFGLILLILTIAVFSMRPTP
ncbi:MAG: DnaJ domain-containing protein [Oligoflexia bacterium]|nr:DnaJ domain-containing protein [Oligoflexia bacterium]